MRDRWEGYVSNLESGDSDRANEAIDEIKNMALEERIELFEVCFDELTEMYAAADEGYVRQSIVRVAEQLTPGIPTVVALDNDDRSLDVDASEIRKQTDALCGFLLEAITDDDGRVRQSAKRGLKDILRTYDALEDEETIEALMLELDEMAAEASGKQQQHLQETKAEARSTLQSGLARLVEGFQEEFGDSLQSDR
jgi:hypothetical protein